MLGLVIGVVGVTRLRGSLLLLLRLLRLAADEVLLICSEVLAQRGWRRLMVVVFTLVAGDDQHAVVCGDRGVAPPLCWLALGLQLLAEGVALVHLAQFGDVLPKHLFLFD